jgi:hypothetical protein
MTAQVRELPTAAPATITTEIIKVSPSMAEKMLGKNVKNRHMNARAVDRYKDAMLAGEWLVTGEAIKFGADGALLDGQHRLAAIIAADKTIPLVVIKGLPSAAQNVLDTGRARTVGDQLGIAGFVDPNALAACAKACIEYEEGRLGDRSNSPSTPRVMEFVEGNGLLAFAVSKGRGINKGCDLRPAVAAMALYELMKIDDSAAQEFFERLTDGVNLPSGSPILTLRAKLRSVHDEHTWLPIDVLVSLVFRTWNAWRAGRKLSSLMLYRNGEPIPCPAPK